MAINRHGLTRDIPDPIKRQIRQHSAFGCVICRLAIYTYEHIDPLWSDATSHDPEKMCLLCPTHQALSTKGRLPKKEIKEAYRRIADSETPEKPTDPEFFSLYSPNFTIKLGSCSFSNFQSIININGRNILSYQITDGTPPYVVSGLFFDEQGRELFKIENNEWIGPVDIWDIEQTGRVLCIRRGPKEIIFRAEKNPEDNVLIITNLDMYFPPFHVFLSPMEFLVGQYCESENYGLYLGLTNGRFEYGDYALYLNSEGQDVPKFKGLDFVGGEGAFVRGTGIIVGRKAERFWTGMNVTVREFHKDISESE